VCLWSVTYFVSHRNTEVDSIVSAHLLLLLILCSVGLFVGLLLLRLLDIEVLNLIPMRLLVLGMFALPLTLSIQNMRGVLSGMQDFRAVGLTDISQPIVTGILLLGLLLVSKLTIMGSLLTVLVGHTVANIVALFLIRRNLGNWHKLIPSYKPRIWHELLSYGSRIFANVIVMILLLRLDILLIGWIGNGTASVGVYSIAVTIGERIWSLTGMVGFVLVARIASWDARDERSNALTALTIKYTFWLSLILTSTLIIFGQWLINFLFGQEFREAYVALLGLAPGLLMIGVAQILTIDAFGRKEAGSIVPYAVAATVSNIILNFILIPPYDILGAAVASSISYSVYSLALIVRFTRKSDLSWTTLFLLDKDDLRYIRRIVELLFAFIKPSPSDSV
ncbi:MAG: polysaccharide biosynthesis C-terminal domain-containing protein, partial [Anaerolineae bacterium]|nr:polysaccharide biosynthesis C-terminal domain-containing protein [Anaerolineae bacterium]